MRGQKKGCDYVSPRTGRPPKQQGNPRKESLNLRLTKEEKTKISNVAESFGMSVTDAIICGIDLLSKSVK